jgi:hypothetical protein
MLFSWSLHASSAPFAWRVAQRDFDDHENGLIEGVPRGEVGALAPRTMGLFAAGFVLGAVAIGFVGIVVTPVDPPAVRPVELRSPDQSDRSRDGADRRRDRPQRRRGSGRRERARPRGSATPAQPRARGQARVQPIPPATAPRPGSTAPRSTPAPRRQPRPRPAPSAPAPAQPAPVPTPAPPADDDAADGDADPSDNGDVDGSGELDNDVD